MGVADGGGIRVQEIKDRHEQPNDFKWAMRGLAGVSLLYQCALVYYVATAFIAPDNHAMAIFFTAVVLSFLAAIDFSVERGYISLTNQTWYMYGGLAFTALVLVGVLTLEVARINIMLNGGPLANKIGSEIEYALQPGIRGIEQKLEEPSKDLKVAQERLNRLMERVLPALRSAPGLEVKGWKSLDVETILREEGSSFAFSGHPGEKGRFGELQALTSQKEDEVLQVRKRISEIQAARRNERETVESQLHAARLKLVEMRKLKLDPRNYEAFYDKAREATNDVQRLMAKYGVEEELNIPNPRSLIMLGIENIWSLSLWTGRVMVMLAILTSFGPVLFIIFFNAHLYRRWEKDYETQMARRQSTAESMARVNAMVAEETARKSGQPIIDAEVIEHPDPSKNDPTSPHPHLRRVD